MTAESGMFEESWNKFVILNYGDIFLLECSFPGPESGGVHHHLLLCILGHDLLSDPFLSLSLCTIYPCFYTFCQWVFKFICTSCLYLILYFLSLYLYFFLLCIYTFGHSIWKNNKLFSCLGGGQDLIILYPYLSRLKFTRWGCFNDPT